MDRFLERNAPRPTQAPQRESNTMEGMTSKMADALPDKDITVLPPFSHVMQFLEDTEVAHAKIAMAVAQILTTMITETVDKAIQQGMEQLKQDLHSQTHRLQETEQWIASVEE